MRLLVARSCGCWWRAAAAAGGAQLQLLVARSCGCWWRVLGLLVAQMDQMDLGSMSVKNLRSIITERGFSTLGLLTRDELVDRAQEAMAAPSLPPLDDGEASADSEEEEVEGKTRFA